jgi:hypothetical protein
MVVYIASVGHSGSTLLAMLLGAHSKIFGIGELSEFKSVNRCSCKKLIKYCSVWKTLFPIFPKIGFRRNKLCSDKKTFKYYAKVYARIMETVDCDVIVDSSKDVDSLKLLLKNDFDVLGVHLVRDGRGVLNSWIKKGGGVETSTRKWCRINEELNALRRLDNRIILVRYEDLVNEPYKVLNFILDKVSLKYEESMLRVKSCSHHFIGGNRMRDIGSEELKLDLSWRTNLSLEDKLCFLKIAGFMNESYGYAR